MARGWESKSVLDQVDSHQSRENPQRKVEMTSKEAEISRQKGVLKLARLRINDDLQLASEPRRRAQLTHALADIEARLAGLSAPNE
jgi:hypothetical protein